MLWHDILIWLTGRMTDTATALAPYTLAIGNGTDAQPGFDNNAFDRFLAYTVNLDKFLPIHDAFIPIFLIVTGWATAFLIIRVAKFILDLIP